MAAKTNHPAVPQPEDPEVGVWRYMDFAKYVSMLRSNCLYFSRLDQLGDPYEGTLSKSEYDYIRERASIGEEEWRLPPEWKGKYFEVLIGSARRARKSSFVNCWHMGNGESEAMWKIYASSSFSIAIRSRYSTLAEVLPEKMHLSCLLGRVEYTDHHIESMPTGNIFYSIMHKRKSFEHERECRAVVWLSDPGLGNEEQLEKNPLGIEVPVSLHTLISSVVIAPTAEPWFADIVSDVTKRYGFEFDVSPSELTRAPYL